MDKPIRSSGDKFSFFFLMLLQIWLIICSLFGVSLCSSYQECSRSFRGTTEDKEGELKGILTKVLNQQMSDVDLLSGSAFLFSKNTLRHHMEAEGGFAAFLQMHLFSVLSSF